MLYRPILLALLLLTAGCAPALTDARAAVNRVADLYAATEPALEKQRTRDGDACFDASPPGSPAVVPCLDAVRTRWRPVEAAVQVTYAALTAAQTMVGTFEAAALMGHSPDLPRMFAVIEDMLEAAARMDAAVDALHREADTGAAVRP